MKLLSLDAQIDVDIQQKGESKEILTVYLRDYTKEESKQFEKLKKKFKDLSKKAQKLVAKANSVEKKMSLYEKAEKFDKAIEMADASDKLIVELDEITEGVEKLGGDEFYEKMAKESFDIRLSGDGKEQLRGYAESKGYSFIMKFLEEEKEDIEKKQQGE